eukprot:8927119-Lingulodinium_polyedra.AAC.1
MDLLRRMEYGDTSKFHALRETASRGSTLVATRTSAPPGSRATCAGLGASGKTCNPNCRVIATARAANSSTTGLRSS